MGRRAVKPKLTPYQRIVKAAQAGRGVRLSAGETFNMGVLDDAIVQAAERDNERDEEGQAGGQETEGGRQMTDETETTKHDTEGQRHMDDAAIVQAATADLATLVKAARELFLTLMPDRRTKARWRRVTGPDGYTRLMGQRTYRAHLRRLMPMRSKAVKPWWDQAALQASTRAILAEREP